MKTVYVINWDNGAEACGTFTHLGQFDTEEAAQAVADDIEAENRAQGVWDDDGFCEVVEIEVSDDDPDDDLTEEADYHNDRNRFADPNR